MNRSHVSKIALLVTIVILLGNAVAISRDYQDGWILEGLELPFVLFVITYAAAFFSERRISWMVALAIIGRTVFLLIPNLKYVWFQGPFIDQHVQYALTRQVFNEGHIATQFAIGQAYTTTPLMHLSFSIFSIILNVPVVDSMKYLPVLWSPIYPLLTYVIVKKMEFPRGTTILKYALFISSVPYTLIQYVVTGTLFGILLAFLVLSNLILMLQKNDRRYWFICTIFAFALAAAHSVTSVILAVSLLAIMALQRVSHFRPKSLLRASIMLAVASIIIAWLMFPASPTLQEIARLIFIGVPSGRTPPAEYISATFFEHARVNILSAMRSFTVFYGADAFFLLLTLAGLIILLKMRKKLNSAANFLSLFGWVILLFIIIGYLMKLGAPRALTFAGLLFPVFSSVLVLYIRTRTWIRPFIFISIILLATIQLYGCQPLVPPANVLYKDLPSNVPMSYANLVNSIYQRQMIDFAESHLRGTIAAVSPTASQIVGLTGINFSVANLVWYYPLDKNQPEQRYDYFLIHLPGRSGVPAVEPRLGTTSVILEAIYNSSIVYTNGESYILAHDYHLP
jgi:hypothetical protein